MQPTVPARKMVVTDLDGTLSHSGRIIEARNLETLQRLGEAGVVRVVATGRSLFSAREVLAADFPIDYLVFSSGAGIYDWRQQELLASYHLYGSEIRTVEKTLVEWEMDFMVHLPIPRNHYFLFHHSEKPSGDCLLRCERLREYASPWAGAAKLELATQFLLAIPSEKAAQMRRTLEQTFFGLSIIRATSPLHPDYTWLEIFAAGVRKSLGAAWIARREEVALAHTLAVGNDYNDVDMLEWAGMGCVVANAPDDLKARFIGVRRSEECGFSHAVERWMELALALAD